MSQTVPGFTVRGQHIHTPVPHFVLVGVIGVCHDLDVDGDFVSTGYPGFQTATYTSRSYAGITPGYTYQFPGNHSTLPAPDTL